jgi:nitroimidazol reductase NimA-like FMN-containing flavoprotein (pyridoxamine 5'-phosphate oxidase superfamily)
MALSIADRQEFLAQPHVAALSVAAGAERGPLIVPIWYHYAPGGPLWISTQPDLRKAALIAEAGRASLLVHRGAPTTRYVSVEGTATVVGPTSDEELRALAGRYLPQDRVDPYIEFARGECRIDLEPQHWLSSDLSAP